MATSKTLTPTNVTISIPAMTDQPNASVLANCADKEADAINALNSQIARTNVGVTLNATGNQYFTHSATHGNKRTGVYSVGIAVTTKAEVPSNTELNIGSVSVNPPWTATGYVVVNNSSMLVGGVQISASGGIYIRLNDSVPSGRDLIIFAMTNDY